MNLIIGIVPQIRQQLIQSLYDCKADFRYSNVSSQIDILEVERFWFKVDDEQYSIVFKVYNNPITNMILIHKDNIKSLELTHGT